MTSKNIHYEYDCCTIIKDLPNENGCYVSYIKNIFKNIPQETIEYIIDKDHIKIVKSYTVDSDDTMTYKCPIEAARVAILIDITLKTLDRDLSMENVHVESKEDNKNSIISLFKRPEKQEDILKENILKTIQHKVVQGQNCSSEVAEHDIEDAYNFLNNLVISGGF
jgi:hypothetical protein